MTTDSGSGAPSPSGDEQPTPAAAEPGAELIQSMLAKAVEVQQGDQRELTTAVGDMRAQLMRLSQELAELRLRPPTDDTADAQLNTVTVEMREAVRFLSERLDGVTRMVAQRGEELADIRTALTAIDAHVRSQGETVGVLSAGMQGIPAYGERVINLQDTVAILHRQLVGIETSLDTTEATALGSRFNALDAGVAALRADDVGGRLGSMEATIASIADRIGGIDAGQVDQADAIAQVRALADELHSGVVGLHARIDPVAVDITAIGTGVTGLVEGSADGAALDSRISESVSSAVRSTEERLIAHIDEAVVALAETLLRRIGAGAPVVGSGAAVAADDDQHAGYGAPAEVPPLAEADIDQAADDDGAVALRAAAEGLADTEAGAPWTELPAVDGEVDAATGEDLDDDGDSSDDVADEGAAESVEAWVDLGTFDGDQEAGDGEDLSAGAYVDAAGERPIDGFSFDGDDDNDPTGDNDSADGDGDGGGDGDGTVGTETSDYVWSSAEYDPATYRGDVVDAEDDGVGDSGGDDDGGVVATEAGDVADDTLIDGPPLQADDAIEGAEPASPGWAVETSTPPDSTPEPDPSQGEAAAATEPELPETPTAASEVQPDLSGVPERDPADPTISLDAPRKRWWSRG